MKTRIIKVLLLLIGLTSLLGQWQRVNLPVGKVSWHEVFLVVFCFASFLFLPYKIFATLKKKLVLLTLLWFFWILITTTWRSIDQENRLLLQVGLPYLGRMVVYFFSGVSLWVWLKQQPQLKNFVKNWVVFWLIGQMNLGLTQYLLFPDTRELFYLGWDDHLNRALGSLLDPGFFGLLMTFGSFLSFEKFLSTSKNIHRHIWSVSLAAFTLGVALSFSRASYLAFVVGFLVYAFLKRQRSILLAIPLLILVLVLIPKDGGGEGQKLLRTNSAQARLEVAEIHGEAFRGSDWLWGKGWYYEGALQIHRQALGNELQTIARPSHSQAVDNSYLHVLFSSGLPGLGLFTVILLVVIWRLRFNPASEAVLSAILVHGLFSTALFYPWVWLIAGSLFIAFFITKEPSSHNKKD